MGGMYPRLPVLFVLLVPGVLLVPDGYLKKEKRRKKGKKGGQEWSVHYLNQNLQISYQF